MTAPRHPLLHSTNKLKLAIFGLNVSHGCSMTNRPEALRADWQESVAIAKAAEAAGIEALIPVARWKGMGGEIDFNHRNFETFTWAAGLSAATERISVFATFHVPTVHPVRAAKEVATIDHISGGRFGLNIVAGWNEAEFAMFGLEQREHDDRYAAAEDWLDLCKALWTREGTFDYDGPYFNSKGAYAEPKPLQQPYPAIMSAGNSPRGMQFAAGNADLHFVVAKDIAAAGEIAAQSKQLAGDAGREVQVFGQGYIVCRETKTEAEDFVDEFVNQQGDWEGVRNLLDVLIPNSQSALGDGWNAMAANMIAGYGAIPLVGTVQDVIDGMQAFSDAGLDGITMSWVDYPAGVEHFHRELLPALVESGLREAPAG